ncbi:MAG TPA: acyl carrier protein [Methylophilaceae bacterium]|nr:acyl carrier protein [Methylophilaceae bacterium]
MNTLERLQELLNGEFSTPRELITPHATLDTFGIDSLGMMELLFQIEKEFKIVIPNDQVEFKTVGQLVAYLDRLIAEQGDSPQLAAH